MLETSKTVDGTSMTIALNGRLDVNTSPDFETQTLEDIADVIDLTLDVAKLEYVSSAGLRALILLSKTQADKDGTCVIVNASDTVQQVVKTTGLTGVLNLA